MFCAPIIEVLPFICDRSVYFVNRFEFKKYYEIFYLGDLEIDLFILLLEMITGHETGRNLKRGRRTRIDRSPDVIDFRPDSHGYVLMSFY